MSYIEILLLAFALSIDASVVSFSYGLIFSQNKLKTILSLAGFTSIFQGLMPCFGYYLTNFIKEFVSPYANFIVFFIFTYLGIKIILDTCKNKKKDKALCLSLKCLLLIGFATSIDAFSAGISLSLYGNNILKPILLITLITFINSCIGYKLGEKLSTISSKPIEIIAGIILIGLGLKVLV